MNIRKALDHGWPGNRCAVSETYASLVWDPAENGGVAKPTEAAVLAAWDACKDLPTVPRQITPLQARKALRAAGLMSAVQAFIASQTEDVQDEWEYATAIERGNATLTGAAAALGLTDAQLDQLFITAATL